MTPHEELVERAAIWLARRCPVVVTELVSTRETPDAIGWTTDGFSVLVEVKVSRNDFRQDEQKTHRRLKKYGYGMGDAKYYLAPKGMLEADDLPDGWGLLEPYRRHCKTVLEAKRTVTKTMGHRNEIGLLLSLLRRFGPHPVSGVAVRAYTIKSDDKRPRATARWLPFEEKA